MWSYFVRDILTSELGIVCGVTLYLTTLTSGLGIVLEYTKESRRLSSSVGYYTLVLRIISLTNFNAQFFIH